jgi:hypothetical protein
MLVDKETPAALCALVFGMLIGGVITWAAARQAFYNQAIEAGAGQYNAKTAAFEWVTK